MAFAKKKFIELPASAKRELSVKYGVDVQTVRLALRFNTDSQVAQDIRRDALAKGGFIAFRAV